MFSILRVGQAAREEREVLVQANEEELSRLMPIARDLDAQREALASAPAVREDAALLEGVTQMLEGVKHRLAGHLLWLRNRIVKNRTQSHAYKFLVAHETAKKLQECRDDLMHCRDELALLRDELAERGETRAPVEDLAAKMRAWREALLEKCLHEAAVGTSSRSGGDAGDGAAAEDGVDGDDDEGDAGAGDDANEGDAAAVEGAADAAATSLAPPAGPPAGGAAASAAAAAAGGPPPRRPPPPRNPAGARLAGVRVLAWAELGPRVRALGSGSLSSVFLHAFEGQDVAVKELSPRLLGALALPQLQDLIHEARVSAALSHDNVAAVKALAKDGAGRFAVVMRFYAGGALAGRVGPAALAPRARFDAARAAAAGLAFLHARGVVHGDVRPANVLIARGDAEFALADGGFDRSARVAREVLRDVGAGAGGRAPFLAPELHPAAADGERDAAAAVSGGDGGGDDAVVDDREADVPAPATREADVYSLALTVQCALLALATPPATPTDGAGAWPEWLPRAAADVLAQSLSADPAKRPTADAVASALKGAADDVDAALNAAAAATAAAAAASAAAAAASAAAAEAAAAAAAAAAQRASHEAVAVAEADAAAARSEADAVRAALGDAAAAAARAEAAQRAILDAVAAAEAEAAAARAEAAAARAALAEAEAAAAAPAFPPRAAAVDAKAPRATVALYDAYSGRFLRASSGRGASVALGFGDGVVDEGAVFRTVLTVDGAMLLQLGDASGFVGVAAGDPVQAALRLRPVAAAYDAAPWHLVAAAPHAWLRLAGTERFVVPAAAREGGAAVVAAEGEPGAPLAVVYSPLLASTNAVWARARLAGARVSLWGGSERGWLSATPGKLLGGGGELTSRESRLGEWQGFTLGLREDGRVTLRSSHGLFVVAEGDGRMNANRKRAEGHEAFGLEQADAGSITLRTAHGTLVSAARPGGVQHRAGDATPAERFVLFDGDAAKARYYDANPTGTVGERREERTSTLATGLALGLAGVSLIGAVAVVGLAKVAELRAAASAADSRAAAAEAAAAAAKRKQAAARAAGRSL